MFIETKTIKKEYDRISKLGKTHIFFRKQTIVIMICDSCQTVFQRLLSKMNRRRLDNRYYHVCANCDAKRFAQKMGVKRRHIWNISVDSDMKIGRF